MASSSTENLEGSLQGFRGGCPPRPGDVFIAVMGVTGSGKSSFISLCSGKRVVIGHNLEGCTTRVDVFAYDMAPGRTVYLIDTPGFDDTTRSDTEILSEIAAWLGSSYKSGLLLNGIIYLHRITDIRMQGSAKRNLMMFRELCGQDALKKVILATTMWDKVPEEEATRREKELTETPNLWGWMLSKGSSFYRHNNTSDSAKSVVHRLANHDAPIATDLQKQLVDERLTLEQTSAGKELHSELNKATENWNRERQKMEQQIETAKTQHDLETEEALREERDRYTQLIEKAEHDREALRFDMEKLLAQRDERVRRMEKLLEDQQSAHESELKEIKAKQAWLEEENEKLGRKIDQEEKNETYGSIEWEWKRLADRAELRRQSSSNREPDRVSRFSVALSSSKFACISPEWWSSNTNHPWPVKLQDHLVATTFAKANGSNHWVARYSSKAYNCCSCLGDEYPTLYDELKARGKKNPPEACLEYCVLGPKAYFYARWQNGSQVYKASKQIKDAISECSHDGNKIMIIEFGYGGSYLVCYGRSFSSPGCVKYDLKGYYEDLEAFLEEHEGLEILALALNGSIPDEYILVYKLPGKTRSKCRYYLDSGDTSADIRKWWHMTCKIADERKLRDR